jgi:DNA polymerase-1
MADEEKKGRGKFFILDGNSLAYRAFFALPLEIQTKKGLHTNAVLGFTNMLLRLLRDESPEYLAVAFDYPAPTFRHKVYREYKATREKTPPELSEQLPFIKKVLKAFNIPVFEIEGYEADDIIGTFCRIGEEAQIDPVIVTADTDVYQLFSSRTKALITRKGISLLEEFSLEKLKRDYNLTPAQWVDFKALKGDSSDNIPGVPGIGEKRALQLLGKYGSLEGILSHKDKIKGKLGENLRAYAEQALQSKDLVLINRYVPVTLLLEECRLSNPSWENLYAVFTELEFKNLIERTPQLSRLKNGGKLPGPVISEAGEKLDLKISQVKNRRELKAFSKKIRSSSFFSLLLPPDAPNRASAAGLFCAPGKEEVFYLPLDGSGIPVNLILEILNDVFTDPARTLLTHDFKPFFKYFTEKGVCFSCRVFDTLLAAYLLEPGRPAYHLTVLYEEYLGLKIPEPAKGLAGEQGFKEEQLFWGRCTHHLFDLQTVLGDNLENRELARLYYELELPLTRVLAGMELKGITVREEILDNLAMELDKEMESLHEEIIRLAGEPFNLSSPKQLSFILFEKLNLPVIRRIKTGYSTDARVLQELSLYHPIAAHLLKYRTMHKLKTTYIDGLRALIRPETGKVHTTFNQTVTATGRLSSKDPNLQNIPVRVEEGRRVREAFTPSREGNLFLAADYSQIELRIMAHLSGDTNLIDAFQREQDIHTRTAAEVFNVPLQDVTPTMRDRAKAVNFGIIYGISDYGLSQDLQISRAESRGYIKSYFKRYPGVQEYVRSCIAMAREKGYVTTVMNRRRYLPDINHSNFNRRSFAERMARNTPVQGSAADIIKAAMLAIDRWLQENKLQTAMILQVHDELIFELYVEELEKVARNVKKIMEGIFPLSVPLKVELKLGRDWYHLYPLDLEV